MTGLTKYRALRYLAHLPTCPAESGSLALCTSHFLSLPSDPAVGQQRPCDSDYLPLGLGDTSFFQPAGFANFAGQTKKRPEIPGVFLCLIEHIKKGSHPHRAAPQVTQLRLD